MKARKSSGSEQEPQSATRSDVAALFGRTPVQSAFVSQLTCLALIGVTPRVYLEQVVPRCEPHVVRVGKSRLIPLEVAVARLKELAAAQAAAKAPSADAEEIGDAAQPVTADQVLARMGLRRVAMR